MAVQALHATAVAIAGEALVIRGPSHAGKSRLALALIARSTQRLPIKLVGDDCILLHVEATGVMARPHRRIAGFIERRGLGIVAMPWTAQAPVAGIVDLGRAARITALLEGVQCLEIAEPCEAGNGAALVLAWWGARGAARATHPFSKAYPTVRLRVKD